MVSITGAVAFVGGAFLTVDIWSLAKPTLVAKITLSLVPGLAMILGAYLLVGARVARVVLSADAVETVGLLSTRRLRFDEIGAKRRVEGALTNYLLYPKRKSQKKLRLEMSYGFDLVFKAWLDAIPDADANFFKNRRD